jgi:exodeoxyribonuclease X
LDFETTGVAPPEEVIEVGFCDVDSETYAVACGVHGKPVAWLCGSERVTAETRAIHHIDPSDLVGRPPWDAPGFVEVARGQEVSYFAAHHANFEQQWFEGAGAPPWVCTYKCALRVWPDLPSHGNQYLRYRLPEMGLAQPEDALCQPAHRAGPDAYASGHLLAAILRTGATVDELLAWTREPALLPRITIGPQKGSKWPAVEAGFLGWMLKQPTMDADLKWNARRELDRRAGR